MLHAASAQERAQAVARLRAGELVALPTETVYGLAGRADAPSTVARIYAVKGRPTSRALPTLVSSPNEGRRWWADGPWTPVVDALTQAFWPGPLTVIAPAAEHTPSWLQSDGTIALRCPNQPDTLAILAELGVPVVCPSANRSEDPSPTSSRAVAEALGGAIEAIVVSDEPNGGMESTIVRVCADVVEILRPGALSSDEIQSVIAGLPSPPKLNAPAPQERRADEGARALYVGPIPPVNGDLHFDVSSVDEALSRIHGYLASMPRSQRDALTYRLEPSFRGDARVDALLRVLNRYLAG